MSAENAIGTGETTRRVVQFAPVYEVKGVFDPNEMFDRIDGQRTKDKAYGEIFAPSLTDPNLTRAYDKGSPTAQRRAIRYNIEKSLMGRGSKETSEK